MTKASHIDRIAWRILKGGVELTTLLNVSWPFFWRRILSIFGLLRFCFWRHLKLYITQFNFFFLPFTSSVYAILIKPILPKLLYALQRCWPSMSSSCFWHVSFVRKDLTLPPRTSRFLGLGILAVSLSSRKWCNPWNESFRIKSYLWQQRASLF